MPETCVLLSNTEATVHFAVKISSDFSLNAIFDRPKALLKGGGQPYRIITRADFVQNLDTNVYSTS